MAGNRVADIFSTYQLPFERGKRSSGTEDASKKNTHMPRLRTPSFFPYSNPVKKMSSSGWS